ncbi:MAG: hypothetical protein ACTTIC_00705 [Helicobacteraceae bacterium]
MLKVLSSLGLSLQVKSA